MPGYGRKDLRSAVSASRKGARTRERMKEARAQLQAAIESLDQQELEEQTETGVGPVTLPSHSKS